MTPAFESYPRPSVAVDVALLGIVDDELVVLLVRREHEPYAGALALPGAFVRLDESLDDAAARTLREKAALADVFVEQLYTFGAPARDPRGRVVAVAYYALVDAARFAGSVRERDAVTGRVAAREGTGVRVLAGDGAPLELAFDHPSIVETAVRRIRGKLDYAPIGYELLPAEFTLSQLQRVHEVVAGRRFNKDSFRRRMLASGVIAATEGVHAGAGRPAALYRYASPRPG